MGWRGSSRTAPGLVGVKKHALLQQLPTRCRFHRDTDHHQNCMFKGEAGGSVSTASPV